MTSPLDWMVRVGDVPAPGLAFERQATAQECHALSTALEVMACHQLTVSGRIKTLPGSRLLLSMRIATDIEQLCVITLEPLPGRIEANLRLTLVTADDLRSQTSEILDPLAEEDEETFDGKKLELGRIVFEELASRLDPFPRQRDATLDWSDPDPSPVTTSPFAALQELKNRRKP